MLTRAHHWGIVVHTLKIGPFGAHEYYLHSIPHNPYRRSPQCLLDILLSLIALLLAWDVLLHKMHVPG